MNEPSKTITYPRSYFKSKEYKSKTIEEKLFTRVNKDGQTMAHTPHLGKCWEWTGGRNDGYGCMKIVKNELTHRISWRIKFGEIQDGMCVLHKCDNRICVNPEHLFLGTNADNVRDRTLKGRSNRPKSFNNQEFKLNPEKVIKIRKIRESTDLTYNEIAKLFNVSGHTIFSICKRHVWANVD